MTGHPSPRREGGRQLTVILKASNMCNGACRFCSVGPAGRRKMTPEDFERFAEAVARHVRRRRVDHLLITFHGGEPTLLGADWIAKACTRLLPLAPRVEFAMQSNLLAISDEMLQVVREYRIGLGSSIDPLFGDRRDAAGRDAFPAWLAGWQRVTEAGLNVGSILVVTKAAVTRAAELYRVCEALGAAGGGVFGLQVNPVYPQGRAAEDASLWVTPEEFGAFLVEIWRRWERSGHSVRLTPVTQLAAAFADGRREPPRVNCMFAGRCAESHVGIDYDLRVAGCGRRLDSEAFLGSLREQGLEEILEQSAERRRLAGRSAALRAGACAGCRFFDLCHGGCPDDAELFSGDLLQPFPWCTSYRMLFEALEAQEAGDSAGRHRGSDPVPRPGPHPQTLVQLGRMPGEFADDADGADRVERWLLPTPDGRALRFDADLAACCGPKVHRLRLWVSNRQVRALPLWQDLVAGDRTWVVLSELEGLDAALNVLNALRATVVLDVRALLALPGGAPALERATERFLRDRLWRAQLHPFSAMLVAAAKRRPVRPTTRLLLEPGTYRVTPSPAGPIEDGEPVTSLVREQPLDTADWLAARRPCLSCELFAVCGGQLADGDGRTCSAEAQALVARVCRVADELRRDLEQPVAGSGA
ncbi:MAG: radical SAM protein [Deltaproteobacteria bacterium]|nr:radical SAM protein [Deltaproteobacteria bacterium]